MLSEWIAFDITGAKTAAIITVFVAVLLYFVFVVVGGRNVGNGITQHTNVHGSARPASQAEALKAARGDRDASPLHDQTFDK